MRLRRNIATEFGDMNLMHARIVPGEPTRFEVSSNRWGCTACEDRWLKIENPFMSEGQKCPSCGKGKIEERFHLVDLASLDLAGCCSCEWHHYTIQPRLRNMTKEQRILKPQRCAHIEYARSFALNVLLKLHILEERGNRPVNPEHEI